jgi:hypothetical protein
MSTTLDVSTGSMLLSVVHDVDGSWIISDHATLTYGHGSSLLHALCDYHAALISTLSVLGDKPVTEQLARQLRTIRWLLDSE